MIRLNLLPHRDERRKKQQQQFFLMAGVTLAIGAVIWASVHTYLSDRIDTQISRNGYLKEEIAKLDKQIAQIKTLEAEIGRLRDRLRVVQQLQTTRAQAVQLLDQLPRQLPDGVYLRGIKQTAQRVTINGVTQSQGRVSTLMRSIDASPGLALEKLGLIEIKAVQQGALRANEFTLNIGLKQPQVEEKRPAPRPAAAEGKK